MRSGLYEAQSRMIDVLSSLRIRIQPVSISRRYSCIRFSFRLLSSPRISSSRLLEAEALLYEDLGQPARIRKDGDSVVIELQNPCPPVVRFDDMKNRLKASGHILPIALGRADNGRDVTADLCSMPHLLIGGSRAEGLYDFLHVAIASIMEARTPDEVRFVLSDINGNYSEMYSESPYLIEHGIANDTSTLIDAIAWLDAEILDRYLLLSDSGCRNIMEYNEKGGNSLPYLVFIVDDLFPVMMERGRDFESYLWRTASKARAAGIHMILASSMISAEIITGTVRNSMPARIAFRTDTALQSRMIIGSPDAVYLSHPDDILFLKRGEARRLKAYRK